MYYSILFGGLRNHEFCVMLGLLLPVNSIFFGMSLLKVLDMCRVVNRVLVYN